MKKLFAALMLSAFTLGTFAASANPVMKDITGHKKMQTDTTKKPAKKDTTKKPPLKK